jgi:FkbM family methyltransferase
MNIAPWVIEVKDGEDTRYGIQVRDIQSANDGDIAISIATHYLLQGSGPYYVIDIGVDRGWWSLFSVEANPTITIDAFEPNPTSFRNLQKYLESTPQLRLHNIAISDKEGQLSFTEKEGESHSRDISGTCIVPCTTLTSYIVNRDVHLIKIDTEGHELRILPTLYPYLSHIKTIIFECSPHWYGSSKRESVEKTLSVLNYLHGHYKYMYTLSRRGNPDAILIPTIGDVEDMLHQIYCERTQVDIVVTNTRLHA